MCAGNTGWVWPWSAAPRRWLGFDVRCVRDTFGAGIKKPESLVEFRIFVSLKDQSIILVSACRSEHLHLRRFFFQRLVLRRLFVPATTQGLVQVDLADQLRQTVGDQHLLRTEQLTLGIEEGQVAVDTDSVT